MLTKLESQLEADAVTVACPTCDDEAVVFVAWRDRSIVMRDKDCSCPTIEQVERQAIADHYSPRPELWASQYQNNQGLMG